MYIPSEALKAIDELPRPAIIGISGFGGAGKSTAAHMLEEMTFAPVVCVDRFRIDRTRDNYTHWKGMDFERLEKEVLLPFSQGENPIHYGHWDHKANSVVKTIQVSHSGLLIVEGVGLFRPELLKYFSYKIWMDCPQDIANARGKKRDRDVYKNPQDEEWDGPWKQNDEEYFSTYKPKDQADLIINNCDE